MSEAGAEQFTVPRTVVEPQLFHAVGLVAVEAAEASTELNEHAQGLILRALGHRWENTIITGLSQTEAEAFLEAIMVPVVRQGMLEKNAQSARPRRPDIIQDSIENHLAVLRSRATGKSLSAVATDTCKFGESPRADTSIKDAINNAFVPIRLVGAEYFTDRFAHLYPNAQTAAKPKSVNSSAYQGARIRPRKIPTSPPSASAVVAPQVVATIPENAPVPATKRPSGAGSVRDTMGAYREKINKIPLLTHEQEIEHAKRIELGLVAERRLEATTDLDDETRRNLRLLARDGKRAKDAFVEANLRMVIPIAIKYLRQDLTLSDLVQHGNLGLMHAVEKFDYRKGFRFYSYAKGWVRAAVAEGAFNDESAIRLPDDYHEQLSKLRRLKTELLTVLGREATHAELSVESGIPEKRIALLEERDRRVVSLYLPVGDDENLGVLGDYIDKTDSKTPFDIVAARMPDNTLDLVLGTLSEREEEVVRLRHGLDDGQPRSWGEVARLLHMGDRRAIKENKSAMAKLRTGENVIALRDYAG